jgi:hypothetical protein
LPTEKSIHSREGDRFVAAPRAASLFTFNTPALTVTVWNPPKFCELGDGSSVPAPDFLNPPGPL